MGNKWSLFLNPPQPHFLPSHTPCRTFSNTCQEAGKTCFPVPPGVGAGDRQGCRRARAGGNCCSRSIRAAVMVSAPMLSTDCQDSVCTPHRLNPPKAQRDAVRLLFRHLLLRSSTFIKGDGRWLSWSSAVQAWGPRFNPQNP